MSMIFDDINVKKKEIYNNHTNKKSLYDFTLKFTFNDEKQSIKIEELNDGDLFYAKDHYNKYIEDSCGDTLFQMIGTIQSDILGDFINCRPIGKVENYNE